MGIVRKSITKIYKVVFIVFILNTIFAFSLSLENYEIILLKGRTLDTTAKIYLFQDIQRFENRYLVSSSPFYVTILDSNFNKIEEYDYKNIDSDLINQPIKSSTIDKNGDLILLFGNYNLYKIRNDFGVERINQENGLFDKFILDFQRFENGNNYFISQNGISTYDGEDVKFDSIVFDKSKGDFSFFPNYYYQRNFTVVEDLYYISQDVSLYKYHFQYLEKVPITAGNEKIQNFISVMNHKDKICGVFNQNNIISYFEYKNGKTTVELFYDKFPQLKKFQDDFFIHSFTIDFEDNYWIAFNSKISNKLNIFGVIDGEEFSQIDIKKISASKYLHLNFIKTINQNIFLSILDSNSLSNLIIFSKNPNNIKNNNREFINYVEILYPNPISDFAKLKLDNEFSGFVSISIVDLLGNTTELYKGELIGNMPLDLDFSDFPSGFYSLIIDYGTKREVVKIIKN